jgi:hypothetical protein
LKKGVVPANLFEKICQMQGKNEKIIRTYLLNFELAVELNQKGDIFIPSIVSEKNEVRINTPTKSYFRRSNEEVLKISFKA